MKSGNIQQFAHLSQFKSVKEFNESTRRALQLYNHHFTKGEKKGLLTLIQYSAKIPGVCNARICQLVQATHKGQEGISRTTFERLLRKGKSLGLFSVHRTTRSKKGGTSHNVFVFHRFDVADPQQLKERQTAQKQATPSGQVTKNATETKVHKTNKNIKDQNLRKETLDSLDFTFVPPYVPTAFVKAVKPFFKQARDICTFWDRAVMAYRPIGFTESIETFLPMIIQAFKHTVYRYKQNRIKTSFIQYYYGTVAALLEAEKLRIRKSKIGLGSWIMEQLED
jgi:uncharacterized protein YoxC